MQHFTIHMKLISHYLSVALIRQKYIVSCRGVVQLGGLAQGSPSSVPLSLKLVRLFYSLKVPLSRKYSNAIENENIIS